MPVRREAVVGAAWAALLRNSWISATSAPLSSLPYDGCHLDSMHRILLITYLKFGYQPVKPLPPGHATPLHEPGHSVLVLVGIHLV